MQKRKTAKDRIFSRAMLDAKGRRTHPHAMTQATKQAKRGGAQRAYKDAGRRHGLYQSYVKSQLDAGLTNTADGKWIANPHARS